MKKFFCHYQNCASYSGTLNCPGLLLPGTRDTHPARFRDSPGHSGTVGHPMRGVHDFGVPRKTLRRHRDCKVVANPGKALLGAAVTVLQEDFERLITHVQSKAFFGLTGVDVSASSENDLISKLDSANVRHRRVRGACSNVENIL